MDGLPRLIGGVAARNADACVYGTEVVDSTQYNRMIESAPTASFCTRTGQSRAESAPHDVFGWLSTEGQCQNLALTGPLGT